jgi:hypothetical protein
MSASAPSTTYGQYANYANYVAQVLLAETTGSVASIANPLATAGLDTAILTDPAKIKAFRDTLAQQMNDASPGPTFEDLSDRITDVIIDTQAQGAGTLEVHLIDPLWVIPRSGFIQADENGYLTPPIDINFPTGTDCVWRLCQYKPTWRSGNGANLVLTFEDRIVSILRQLSAANTGVLQGSPNQTLSDFFKLLIDQANKLLKPKPPILYVPLVSGQDPNYVLPVTQVPARAEAKLKPKGLAGQMQALINEIDNSPGGIPTIGLGGAPSSLADAEKQGHALMAQLQSLLHNIDGHQLGTFPGTSTPPGGGFTSSTNNAAGYPIYTPNP